MTAFMTATNPDPRPHRPAVDQDFVDTIPVKAKVDVDLCNVGSEGYPIGLPDHLRRQPRGLDQQGRYPWAAHDDEDADDGILGWGAFLPVYMALAMFAACAALVMLLT